ncbi:hypothetical protein [Sutcliffiella horikoshii]|uniref:hypothetical protein n=1 Tax=Sutcliffiella horikoshii TaxID=79883 RepID=UPI001FD214B7|nr:hypothetical protein [Sutcliffiella horikoshii]
MEIIEIRNKDQLLDKAIQVFWQQWGSEENFKFYEDAILHSATTSYRDFMWQWKMVKSLVRMRY